MVGVTDREGAGRHVGACVPRPEVGRARARLAPLVIVAGAAVWLIVVLLGAAEHTVAGAAWVRVALFVVAVAVLAAFAVLAARSPPPTGAARPAEVRGGYGIDGPEQRRVRRALRDGTPLRPGDRDRALAQARRSLFRTTPGGMSVRDRNANVAVLAYVLATGLVSSPSLTAPTFESSDLWTFVGLGVAAVVVAAVGWLPGRPGVPGRRWRETRLRQRIEVLENHPVAQ